MILNQTPLSLAEAKEYIPDLDEKKELKAYFKKFSKLSKKDAEKLSSEIRALNNFKIKEQNMVKIIDTLPKSHEELNKVFTEVALTEEEANAVLEIVGKY
jgi:DNA-directed RNA polymerase subunit F